MATKNTAAKKAEPTAVTTTAAPAAGMLITDIDTAVKAALKRGDHGAYAHLSGLQVALGSLKYKADHAATQLKDGDAELVEKLRAAL